MPRDKRAKIVAAAAAPDLEPLEDRISALPDGILQHVLGFLPADEAVRTCVLARHWRHQWRSVRRLRINYDMPVDVTRFVNRLLLLRARGMDLDEFEVSKNDLEFVDIGPSLDEETHIWIQHALLCKVRILIIDLWAEPPLPLVSQYLNRLEVHDVDFETDCLDFAACPTLEVLHITQANLFCSRILSQSIKHLRIICSGFPSNMRVCISMPSFITLHLNNFHGKAPILESMPSLQAAFLRPDSSGVDTCMKRGDYGGDCCGICACCCGEDGQKGHCILLGGLSNATCLELIAYRGKPIFRRDLRWCPTFSKLKTLLLNEWFVSIDLSALVCILEHSPVLEKLILQISHEDTECKPESEGRNHQMELTSYGLAEGQPYSVSRIEGAKRFISQLFGWLNYSLMCFGLPRQKLPLCFFWLTNEIQIHNSKMFGGPNVSN